MTENNVRSSFHLINYEDGLRYLEKQYYISYDYGLVKSFIDLDEKEKATYEFPISVLKKIDELRSEYGRKSSRYIRYNTIITSIYIIKYCAGINISINNLAERCRYTDRIFRNTYTSHAPILNWNIYSDKDVIAIKNAATVAINKINTYSRVYTVDNFEKDFVEKIKEQVLQIAWRFNIDTSSTSDKLKEAGGNCLGEAVLIIVGLLVITLIAKCATGGF